MESLSIQQYIRKYLLPIKVKIDGNTVQSAAELQRDIWEMTDYVALLNEHVSDEFKLQLKLHACIEKATLMRDRKKKLAGFNAREFELLLK